MSSGHLVPFFCPYCGEESIEPFGEAAGGWVCPDCRRQFTLRSGVRDGRAAGPAAPASPAPASAPTHAPASPAGDPGPAGHTRVGLAGPGSPQAGPVGVAAAVHISTSED